MGSSTFGAASVNYCKSYATEDGREFGFEFVAFTFHELAGGIKQEATFALTDIDEDLFHFETLSLAGAPPAVDGGFSFALEDGARAIRVTGTADGKATLAGISADHRVELEAEPAGSPVVRFDGMPRPFQFGGWTYYYSYPAQSISGSLLLPGDAEPRRVTGKAWFDRQAPGAIGYFNIANRDWIGTYAFLEKQAYSQSKPSDTVNDPEVDGMIAQVMRQTDREKINALMRNVYTRIRSEHYGIPVVYLHSAYATSKTLGKWNVGSVMYDLFFDQLAATK